MQIILVLLGLVVLGMFSTQAYLRRTTRDTRLKELEKQEVPVAEQT
jgi:hypothetical protein